MPKTILAIGEKRVNNASGALGLHVLEIMDAFVRSAKTGEMITLESSPTDAIALDYEAPHGVLRTK